MSTVSKTDFEISMRAKPNFPLAGARAFGAFSMQSVALGEWDRLVSGFDGVCQEQLYAYSSSRWPGLTFEPLCFMDGNAPVGGALMMIQRLPMGLASVALCKWGPMLADSARDDAAKLRLSMVEEITRHYAQERGMLVTMMARTDPSGANSAYSELLSLGYREGQGVRYPDRYFVDIMLDDEARMAAFAQKWRYHLRKSLKAGLAFEHAPAEHLVRFMALYDAMSARKQFPDHSAIRSLDRFMATPDGTARPELFFVTHQGKTVAGAVIFTAGDTATYLYGATDDTALELRAGYFLHWHIIRWLRDNTKARLYDLGGTDGFQGLHQFKAGMVGSAGSIAPIPPMANFSASRRARWVGNAAYAARSEITRVRDSLTVARLALLRHLKRDR